MSNREESLNDEAIFLCLVRGCVVSACREVGEKTQRPVSKWSKARQTDRPRSRGGGEAEDAATAYLVNFIGQLGQDGDPDDTMLHTVLQTNTGTSITQWHEYKKKWCCDKQRLLCTPAESVSRRRWHFWTRSRPSGSQTSRAWWSWRTAGSGPGSQTPLALAALPGNSAHSSLSKAQKPHKTIQPISWRNILVIMEIWEE